MSYAVDTEGGRSSSKDCLEDLRVVFNTTNQTTVNSAQSIKCRTVEVASVSMEVESVPFNKGFYSVDMTFYFLITVDVYTTAGGTPTPVSGIAAFSKKVILYGSEGSVRVLSSTESGVPSDTTSATPVARIQTVDPILLSCRLSDTLLPGSDPISIPQSLIDRIGGGTIANEAERYVYVTVGMFSIVQLEREVQMMIPIYDYCVPDKECASSAGDPCELFRKIRFPVNEFFPPRLSELPCDPDEES